LYILVYDIPYGRELSGTTFYRFDMLRAKVNAKRLQQSVFLCEDKKGVMELADFLRKVGANVRIFKVEEEVGL